MEEILGEDGTTEQTEFNTIQSVAADKNRPAKESEVTSVDTKVRCVFYIFVVAQAKKNQVL